MLTKDLALYQDTIATFNLSALNDRFEMLRQLGNVFIVQPDILKSYLTESYLARIENRLLRPFVMMRTDYGEHSRKFWEDVFGPEGGVDVAAAGSGSSGGGFSRASGVAAWGGLAVGAAMARAGSAGGQGGQGQGQGQGGASPSLTSSFGTGGSPAVGGAQAQALRTQRNGSLFGLGGLMKEFEGMGLSEGGRTSFAGASER